MNSYTIVPRELSFSYEKAFYSTYNDHYQPKDFIKRKIVAIPNIFFSGILLSIFHLAKAIIYGIPKACMKDFNPIKKNVYCFIRDLEEALGWGVIVFNDKKGFDLVQKSRSHKKCYSFAESKIKFLLKRKKEIATFSQEEIHKMLKNLSLDELECLSEDHIKRLDVSLLSKEQIQVLFSSKHLKRLGLLSSEQVQKIINDLKPDAQYFISDEQLKNLDLTLLNKECVMVLFPSDLNLLIEENIKKRFFSLSLKNKGVVVKAYDPYHQEFLKKSYGLTQEQFSEILKHSNHL